MTGRPPSLCERQRLKASDSVYCGPTPRADSAPSFVALDAELNREVALKRILDDYADDLESRQRVLGRGGSNGGPGTSGDRPGLRTGHV